MRKWLQLFEKIQKNNYFAEKLRKMWKLKGMVLVGWGSVLLGGCPLRQLVLVDNQCAVDNVSRFAANQGYAVQVEAQGADFLLKLSK